MRVPTSVLLAVLAAAGLLALAPALVRRYDATERLVAERAQSTARVLQRRRRRRTVPGRRPVHPPRSLVITLSEDASTGGLSAPVSAPPAARRSKRLRAVPPAPRKGRRRPPPRRQHAPAVYRRRRVLAALLLLNFVELIGVVVVSPGFWISFGVSATLLVAYVVHLRRLAVADRRRRRARAREAAWLAARQAEVRREQARRAAARREAQRRLAAQREVVRRAAMGLDRPADLPAAANGGSVSYRRSGGLRGRPYQSGRGSHSA
ncbi:divisome protein SepX/GlpR [Micromonospora sp. SD12]|uniref:divisome protein SepX/GlpR n=1 Tax=Micromonospora sp. SD12 TaxID=3452216 RepID=UPI003F8B095E